MTQKLKLWLGMGGLALLIVVAAIAHNVFANRVEPMDRLILPEEREGIGEEVPIQRRRAPDFSMVNWNGNVLRLSDIIVGGQPVVLNFWASWCPSCRREKPGFETVYRDIGEQVKFVMLGLVDGVRETIETGQRYITDGGFTLPVYFDIFLEGVSAYGIRFIPATVFIDRDGYIVTEVQGELDEQSLRRAIDFLLQ